MRKRYELTEAQWNMIKDLLPHKAGDRGHTTRDSRTFVNGTSATMATPRAVTSEACRALMLDMIYDEFSVRTRMSRLPGENRMAGATGPCTATGEARVALRPRPFADGGCA